MFVLRSFIVLSLSWFIIAVPAAEGNIGGIEALERCFNQITEPSSKLSFYQKQQTAAAAASAIITGVMPIYDHMMTAPLKGERLPVNAGSWISTAENPSLYSVNVFGIDRKARATDSYKVLCAAIFSATWLLEVDLQTIVTVASEMSTLRDLSAHLMACRTLSDNTKNMGSLFAGYRSDSRDYVFSNFCLAQGQGSDYPETVTRSNQVYNMYSALAKVSLTDRKSYFPGPVLNVRQALKQADAQLPVRSLYALRSGVNYERKREDKTVRSDRVDHSIDESDIELVLALSESEALLHASKPEPKRPSAPKSEGKEDDLGLVGGPGGPKIPVAVGPAQPPVPKKSVQGMETKEDERSDAVDVSDAGMPRRSGVLSLEEMAKRIVPAQKFIKGYSDYNVVPYGSVTYHSINGGWRDVYSVYAYQEHKDKKNVETEKRYTCISTRTNLNADLPPFPGIILADGTRLGIAEGQLSFEVEGGAGYHFTFAEGQNIYFSDDQSRVVMLKPSGIGNVGSIVALDTATKNKDNPFCFDACLLFPEAMKQIGKSEKAFDDGSFIANKIANSGNFLALAYKEQLRLVNKQALMKWNRSTTFLPEFPSLELPRGSDILGMAFSPNEQFMFVLYGYHPDPATIALARTQSTGKLVLERVVSLGIAPYANFNAKHDSAYLRQFGGALHVGFHGAAHTKPRKNGPEGQQRWAGTVATYSLGEGF